jgi:hypothetical protein
VKGAGAVIFATLIAGEAFTAKPALVFCVAFESFAHGSTSTLAVMLCLLGRLQNPISQVNGCQQNETEDNDVGHYLISFNVKPT